MPSKVTRDHHTWTRDITSRVSGAVKILAEDDFVMQVGQSGDGGWAHSAFQVFDKDGQKITQQINTVDLYCSVQIYAPNQTTGVDSLKLHAYPDGAGVIETSDASGSDAYLKINPDGYLQLEATDLRLAYDDNDYTKIEVDATGDITLKAIDEGSQVQTGTATFDGFQDFLITTSSNGFADPSLQLKNTDTGDYAPKILLSKFPASQNGAADELLGNIEFWGHDDAQNVTKYVNIESQIASPTNNSEGGRLLVKVASHDGDLETGLKIEDGDADGELDVDIAAGTSSVTTVAGNALITTIAEVGSDTDKILMSDSGTIKYATGANILSYIGAQATVTAGTNCTFSGATLNVDDAFVSNSSDDTMGGALTIDKASSATIL